METEQKKQILLNSYNILAKQSKINWDVDKLIGSLSIYDFDLAIELWKDAIRRYPEDLHNNVNSRVGWSTKYEIECKVGQEKIDDCIINDDFLKKKLFLESRTYVDNFVPIVLYCLRIDDLKTASELVELIKANIHFNQSFRLFLAKVVSLSDNYPLSKDATDLIIEWSPQVNSEEDKVVPNNLTTVVNDNTSQKEYNKYQWREKYQQKSGCTKCLLFPYEYETEEEYTYDLNKLREKGIDENKIESLGQITGAYFFSYLSESERRSLFPIAFFRLDNGDFFSWIAKKDFGQRNIINNINLSLPGFSNFHINRANSVEFLLKPKYIFPKPQQKSFYKYTERHGTIKEEQLKKDFYILVEFVDNEGYTCFDIYYKFEFLFELHNIDKLLYNLNDFNVNYMVGYNERENKQYYFIKGVPYTPEQLNMSFFKYCESFGELYLLEQYAETNNISTKDLAWNDSTAVEWKTIPCSLSQLCKNSIANRTSVYEGKRFYDKIVDIEKNNFDIDIPPEFLKTSNNSIPLTMEQIRFSIIKKIQEQIAMAYTGDVWIQNDENTPEYVNAVITYPAGKHGDIDYYLAKKYGKILNQIDALHYKITIPSKDKEIIALIMESGAYDDSEVRDFSEIKDFMCKYNVFYSLNSLFVIMITCFSYSPYINKTNDLWLDYRRVLRQRRNKLYSDIIKEGESKYRWKTESQVFSIISSKYPDTIFQYHAEWLGKQSLDVFIPSLSIGIEYQGMQHYEPIEHFGGEEGLARRKKLDAKKRDLCKDHNIKLIEIKYDEQITEEQIISRIMNS